MAIGPTQIYYCILPEVCLGLGIINVFIIWGFNLASSPGHSHVFTRLGLIGHCVLEC